MTDKDFLWLHLKDLPYFRAILRANEAAFYQGIKLPSPVLDIGSGDGHFASVTFDQKLDVGVDPSLTTMREAQRRGAYLLLTQADGAAMPLADASMGSAVSNSVLEHIPHLDAVLEDLGRVLKPGAPFAFTVPNPGYRRELSFPIFLRRIGLKWLGERYADYFMWMSRTKNMFYEDEWRDRLERAGLMVERTFRYFPPRSLHALEWGHYFGGPSLLPRWITGRWIVAPTRWNLWLTEKAVRRYVDPCPDERGTYSFYLARKRS